jgi:hypothetical protein
VRNERVADRLFEEEEAVLHVFESIVDPWVFRSTQHHRGRTRDFRTALRCRPDFLEPFSALGPVLAAELCGLVQIGSLRRISRTPGQSRP